jgi:indole-3-acetate monooxygenase
MSDQPFATPVTDPRDLPALLRPSIEAVSQEMDERGDVPGALHALLRDSGAFGLLTPRELGGFELALPDVLTIYEELGRIDASVAWLVWNANFGFIGALLDEDATATLWRGGREPAFANSGAPGTAERADGGYRLSGHWKIVSGVNHAEWVVVVAVVTEGGEPVLTESGPDVRLFAVRRDQLEVEQTWNVTGMRGSGSNDVRTSDALVPAGLAARFDVPPRVDRPLYRGYLPALVLAGCSAVVLGVARAAVDEIVRLAPGKRSLGSTLAELPRAQFLVGESEASVRAARLLLLSGAEALRSAGERGEQVTLGQRADLRAAMSHAARVSRTVLTDMYELGSSVSLYGTNALERIHRDGMAALQHANHSAVFLEGAGRVRFGLDPALPLF